MSEQIMMLEFPPSYKGLPSAAALRKRRKKNASKGQFTGHTTSLLSIVGKRFGKLEVKSFIGTRRGRSWWQCICDCGQQKEVRGTHLTQNQVTSCGCQNPRRRSGSNSVRWVGCGEISGCYYSMLKHGAAVRGYQFSVTISEIWSLFLDQGKKCALSGIGISFRINRSDASTASLDRIDSRRGYVLGNIQWVHKDINRMKGNFTEDRFINLCRLVTERKNVR
jgi:hypothetical protein